MKNKKRITIIAAIIIVIGFLIFLRFSNDSSTQRGKTTPVIVEGRAVRGEIIKTESLTGDILPVQQATIYSKVGGNIEKIFVDIGDRVQGNQILALIDTTIYAQNVRQSRANYMQAEANYENTSVNFERNKKLFEQNLIAKQDLDNAKTAMDVAGAQKEAAYASYTNSLTQLSYCKIRAPFGGTITKRMLDPGAYVTSSGSSQGTDLFTLMNVNNLKSIVNVPEKYVPLLNKIQGIEVEADALPGKIFSVKLKKISDAVDLSTRTMAVEIDIENPTSVLKPGMFADITLILERKPEALILPNQVVLNDDNGNFIYKINPDSTVSKQYVQIGIQQDNRDEILSGVNDGDRIVFVGQSLIKDKMKVKISK